MTDKFESLRLKNQLCFPLYLCSKELVRRYAPVLDKLDLTYTQYVVMMYLWEVGQANVKEIGETLILDPSTLTPLLKKLESKGYITRTRSLEDERSLVIKLTQSGDRLKEDALSIPETMKCCLGISTEEAKTLYTILYKVLVNIEASYTGKNNKEE